jgi:hypothetical protein
MRWLGAGVLVILLALVGAPQILAHEAHQTEGMDDQLVSAGEGLMVGSFDAPQDGPLVVVPYVEGPVPCGGVPTDSHLIPVGKGAAVSFVANESVVQANLDLPPAETGFASFALDTDRAHRTMMLMLEHAIAMHAMGAAVFEEEQNGTFEATFDDGMMGVPYLFPDAANASRTSKYFLQIDSPGGGIRMDYDMGAPASWCEGDEPGHYAIRLDREAMGEALDDGAIVHGLVHWDDEVPQWLPRPIPSTAEFQVNLYLTRPSEDPQSIRDALDPAPRAQNVVSMAGLLAGLALTTRRVE